MTHRALRVLGAFGLLLLAGPAFAQAPEGAPDGNKALAIEWANRAQDRLEAGDYRGAVEAIQEAEKHARPPTFALLHAEAEEKLGHLVSARQRYQAIVDMTIPKGSPPAWGKAQKTAKTELAALLPRIPRLAVSVTGADTAALHMTLDGAPFEASQLGQPQLVDPGKHRLVVEAEGRQKAVREPVGREGAETRVDVVLLPAEAGDPGAGGGGNGATSGPPSPPSPILSVGKYVSFGIAGAGLVAGAVTGGIVLSQMDPIGRACSDDRKTCSTRAEKGIESVGTLADVSTAGFVVAGAFAATGLVLLLIPSKKPPPVGIGVGPGSVAVRGTF
jgi:hypothetical protein